MMRLGVARKRKMDEKRLSILDLNHDCLLKIIKYIIADCELRDESPVNPSRYADMENFAKAYENIKELIRIYHKDIYYHRELTKVVRSVELIIDFAQLQSTIVNKHEGDAYWKVYTKAIRENRAIYNVKLTYDAATSYPEFPNHFQMIKCALENKTVRHLNITLKGYALDDLNNFENIEFLYLDVPMSADALVSVCKSNSRLYMLEFMSTEIEGRLSDILPHCPQLIYLSFVPKPGVDVAEYAPLAQLPKLGELTIFGALKNGSLLTMLEGIRKWQRAGRQSFIIHFRDELLPSSNVAIIAANSLLSLDLRKGPTGMKLTTSYDFIELSEDSRPLEQSLATITIIVARFNISWLSRRLTLHRCPTPDVSDLISLLMQLNINGLTITIIPDCEYKETSIAKLFGSMIPDALWGLKSICINGTKIDKLTTRELVKIKSITFLNCSFYDWESVDLLSELTSLQALDITVEEKFKSTFSKALCNLLDTFQVCAIIRCKNGRIEFKKNEKIPSKFGTNTLQIFHYCEIKFVNEVAEALSNRIFNANDELIMSHSHNAHFRDIVKVADIKNLKKLRIRLSNVCGIEKLSNLTELEELTIWHEGKDSLIKLFDQLAMKESPSLQCLRLYIKPLSPEELIMVSRIKSLKKLELHLKKYDCAAINALANSNIEELKLEGYRFPRHKLFAEFPKNNTNRLWHLNIKDGSPDLVEVKELSKLKELRHLRIYTLDSKSLPFLNELKHLEILDVFESKSGDLKLNLPSLKKLVIRWSIGIKEWKNVAKLGHLESLNLHSNVSARNCLRFIANMKNLKELSIKNTHESLSEMYKSFARKGGLKLEHLNATITCVEELNQITRIKSLRKLRLFFESELETNSGMGQLTELESLDIEFNDFNQYKDFENLNCVPLLAILESCKNLAHFTIKSKFYEGENFIRKVHTLLKSIRDPSLQRPLILTVLLDISSTYSGYEFDMSELDYDLVEFFDDAYLKVYCSFNQCYMR